MGTENNEQKGTKQKCTCYCVSVFVRLYNDVEKLSLWIHHKMLPRFYSPQPPGQPSSPTGQPLDSSIPLELSDQPVDIWLSSSKEQKHRVTACIWVTCAYKVKELKKSTDRQLNWLVVGWWWSLEVKQGGTPWDLWRLQSLEHPSQWRGSLLLCWHMWQWSNSRETYSHECAEHNHHINIIKSRLSPHLHSGPLSFVLG